MHTTQITCIFTLYTGPCGTPGNPAVHGERRKKKINVSPKISIKKNSIRRTQVRIN